MDKEFYTRKIQQLSDDKLKELLQFRSNENLQIMTLAENEAIQRGIDLQTIENERNQIKTGGKQSKKVEGVSWTNVLADILSGLS